MHSDSDIRIFLLGNEGLFVAGLCSLIQAEPGLTVVAQAASWTPVLDMAAVRPDLILFDLSTADESALDVLSDLIQAAPAARILIVTAHADIELYRRAMVLGAMGVLLKIESTAC